MDETMRLRIGKTRVEVALRELPAARLDDIRRRYAAFVEEEHTRAPGSPRFFLAVSMRPGQPFLECRPRGMLPLYTRRIGRRVVFATLAERGSFDLDTRRAWLTLRPSGNIENYLRVLVAWDAALRGGLLLHASGIVREGRAYVFFGASGAGKSTVAQLSARWPVLSDDLVLLDREGDGYHACGVPFRGSEWTAPRLNLHAPLAGLFALEQAPRTQCLALAPPAAAARLVSAAPFVTTCPRGAAAVLGSALALTAATPVARLQFRKDDSFWEVIYGRGDKCD